jgi:hypothetical protein
MFQLVPRRPKVVQLDPPIAAGTTVLVVTTWTGSAAAEIAATPTFRKDGIDQGPSRLGDTLAA